jgi:hypothetical protein
MDIIITCNVDNPTHEIQQRFLINPLKSKLFLIIFKHAALASMKTPPETTAKINWLMLSNKEIIAVYSENHMKPINTLCG